MSDYSNVKHLGNPTNTIEILDKYGFSFQKKFGQNFLIDENVVRKIVREAGVTKDDFVLEIGPGIGTMTQILCEEAREVVAVEQTPVYTANGLLIPNYKANIRSTDGAALGIVTDRYKIVQNTEAFCAVSCAA